MVSKWWGAGLIAVLGVVWLVLAEMPTGTSATAQVPRAGTTGPVAPRAGGQTARQNVVGPRAPVLRRESAVHDPAQAVPGGAANGATAPSAAPKAGESAPSGTGRATERPAQGAHPARALAEEALAAAASQRQAGDDAGAEATLRDALQRAKSAAEAARIGLFLAPFVKDLAERRELLSAALLENVVFGPEFDGVGQQLAEINRSPGASLQPLLQAETYTVASGDSLWKLCNKTFPSKLGVTAEIGLVRLINGLGKDSLRVGQKLVVPRNQLGIRVCMGAHGLALFLDDHAVAAYRVGLGRENRTPRGSFVIRDKQENPAWFNNGRTIPFGDPENVLGTRWMGFEDKPGASGFGIHGTADPDSIGGDESMGCVRMRNEQVEELFDLVPRGTTVVIG